MRLPALLLALLLLSLPLAGAEDGCEGDACDDPDSSGSGGDGGSGPDDGSSGPSHGRPDCDDENVTHNQTACDAQEKQSFEEYCAEHADDARCRAAHERFRAAAQRGADGLRHISFTVDRENRTLHDYAVDGRIAFDALVLDDPGAIEVRRDGSALVIRTNDTVLRLHDNVAGNMEFKSDEDEGHSLVLDLPAGALTGRRGDTDRGDFLEISYGSYVGKLAADRIVMDGDRLTVTGYAGFHLEPKTPARSDDDREVQDALEDAERSRHLGAKVSISKPAAGAASGIGSGVSADMADSSASDVEVTQYDDMDIQVRVPHALVGNETLEVIVSAELSEGRTVALDIDPALLNGLPASVAAEEALDLRYYDLNDDGSRTRVYFERATDIQDVLDPTNDDGQPEYWIVEDADGIHVLVSFPHWSTHIVTLQNVAEFLTQPSVIVGVMAGIGGVAVAAATMFIPRRREEELY